MDLTSTKLLLDYGKQVPRLFQIDDGISINKTILVTCLHLQIEDNGFVSFVPLKLHMFLAGNINCEHIAFWIHHSYLAPQCIIWPLRGSLTGWTQQLVGILSLSSKALKYTDGFL